MTRIARTSGTVPPLTIEEVREIPASPDDEAAVAGVMRELFGKTPSGYIHARVGILPLQRLIRRVGVEARRVREPDYVDEVAGQQFKVDPARYRFVVVEPSDGSDFDPGRVASKEACICGALGEEIDQAQEALLARGIFPERLEIETISIIGGVLSYMKVCEIKAPLLLLEIGMDATQSFIVGPGGLDVSRPIPHGVRAMIPIVQKELGLKDEESARKLFFSNSFDFTGMGPQLTKRMVKELQSSIGFYEVQTGQSVGHVFCALLPPSLSWLNGAMNAALGAAPFTLDMRSWLSGMNITFAGNLPADLLDQRYFGLYSLMGDYDAVPGQTR